MADKNPDAAAASSATRNVDSAAVPSSTNTPKDLQDTYDALVNKATSAMEWYESRQQQKKRGARYTRTAAIVFGALTAIIPSVIALFPDRVTLLGIQDFPTVKLNPIATILGILAATIILFDKFYGFSSSWIRF